MDFFVTDSLQDMLDIDIRSDVATVLGGSSDVPLGLFNELPPLELDSPKSNKSALNWYCNLNPDDSSIHNVDIYGSEADCVMVDPSSVMPVVYTEFRPFKSRFGMHNTHVSSSLEDSPTSSPESKQRSHLTFSPNTIKLTDTSTLDNSDSMEFVKRDLTSDLVNKESQQSSLNNIYEKSAAESESTSTKAPSKSTFIPGNIIRLTPLESKQKTLNSRVVPLSKMEMKPMGWPKPAYSYSCLIAMALKNSQYGSLPVSEIYSFMCEHFPYFKTAPNGWKNSVRHNLSLNKCFEKIEKPAATGGQRKGCLWAMNPAKITKMDEEVQKWSRKDPMAIRKAMVFPEHLEALERGEMTHLFLDDDSEPENGIESHYTEDNSESEIEEPDIEVEEILESNEDMSEAEGLDENMDVNHMQIEFIKSQSWNSAVVPVQLQLISQDSYLPNSNKRNRIDIQYTYIPAVTTSGNPTRRKIPLPVQ